MGSPELGPMEESPALFTRMASLEAVTWMGYTLVVFPLLGRLEGFPCWVPSGGVILAGFPLCSA